MSTVCFDITGKLNDEFIVEVSDSQTIKRQQIWFAMMVNGLAGDLSYGVGLSYLVGEAVTWKIRQWIEKRIKTTLIDLITNVRYDGSVINLLPEQQMIAVDLMFTDLDSNAPLLVPLGFRT